MIIKNLVENEDGSVDFDFKVDKNENEFLINYAVKALTRLGVVSTTAVASVDFDNVTYSSASFTAAFAAIYNTDTVDGTANRLVVVLDFGGNKTATNGTFTVTFPDPTTPANAIISMS